ncbi:glycerate kinase [soil metagenome]
MIGRPMKIVLAPDKFKGCLSAIQVAEAMAIGAKRARPDVVIDHCPVADGGEGFVETLVRATGGRFETHRVTGPLPEMKVNATFGVIGAEGTTPKTAVIEMSSAAGLALLKPTERDPMATTTFGVGELLRAAVELGCRRVLLGIGGSATVDGGIGCAQATGHTIVLQGGEPISATEPLTGRDLERVVLIKQHRCEITDGVEIIVACDVTNPLYGPTGAAHVFGPQKGATPAQVEKLDAWLRELAIRTDRDAQANTPGAGAAGGLGFGLLAFFNAKLESGIELVLSATKLHDRLRGADLCITGEGRLDSQSVDGKAVGGVAGLCGKLNVPCFAIAGAVESSVDFVSLGLKGAVGIRTPGMSLEDAMKNASTLIATATEVVVKGNHV